MIKYLALFGLLFSCAYLIEKIDAPLVSENRNSNKSYLESSNYCPLEQKVVFQLIGTSQNSQNVYLDLVKSLPPSLDFLEHLTLWSLLQLSIRPDQSSATSRFQILLHLEDKSYYFDFFSEEKEDQFPLLFGLEWILKKFNKKKSLEEFANLLSSYDLKGLKITKEFEHFLVRNSAAIKNDPELSPFYFRGLDILKENETSPKLDYKKVMSIYRKVQTKQKIIINTTLSPFVTEKGSVGSCNYDFNLYDNSIFLIDKAIPVANIFGLGTAKSAFLASTSQKLEKMNSLSGLSLFKGESKVRSSAVCMIENNNNKIWAFSNQSRDPGQHLFHLVRYGLPSASSVAEVAKLIRHSRHLFLSDPVRLIIESGRSSSEQIENLLKLNLPIYNADKLGNIWAYSQFSEGKRFIIDDRNPGSFLCR